MGNGTLDLLRKFLGDYAGNGYVLVQISGASSGAGIDVRIVDSSIAVPVDIQYDSLEPVSTAILNQDESVAQSISLDTGSYSKVSVYASATTATNFYLEVSSDNSNWLLWKTYSSVTSVAETLDIAFRYVRLRSDAAGTSGTDTVSLALSAKP